MDVRANTKYGALMCIEASLATPGLFSVVSDDAVKYTGPMHLEWDIKGARESWVVNFLGYGKLPFNKIAELVKIEDDILCAVIPKSRIKTSMAFIRSSETDFVNALTREYKNYMDYLKCACRY